MLLLIYFSLFVGVLRLPLFWYALICIVLVAFIVVWLSCYSICSVDLPRGVVS